MSPRGGKSHDAESENCAEHCGDIRYPPSGASCEAGAMRGAEPVCAGDRLVLRVVGADGGGGLTAAEMVKYAASDDGKNGQI